jgi:hypothetical protein
LIVYYFIFPFLYKCDSSHVLFLDALSYHMILFCDEFFFFPFCSFGSQTRTSSPIQIPRNIDTYESTSLKGLYPVGEGAGYAGGIVSAAVDGMHAGFAVARNFDLYDSCVESFLGKAQGAGFVRY